MSTKIKDILGVLSILLVGILFVFMVAVTKDRISSTDPANARTITMSAQGKVSARPDTATLSFSVVTEGESAEDVQTENDAKMSQVINFIKESGVDEQDIKTSGYNLYPQRNFPIAPDRGEPEIVGYSLTQTVTVTIRDTSKVQNLVGGLTSGGINQINNVSYFIDDPDALKAQAREQAVAKAKEKADALAQNLGIRLGKVINYSEGDSSIPIPYQRSVPASFSEDAAASPIEAGSQDITVNVSVVFEIK